MWYFGVRVNSLCLLNSASKTALVLLMASPMPIQPFVELALGIYFTATVFYALANGIYGTLPFLVLFQFGYLYMGLMSIFQQFRGDDVLMKAPQIAGGE